MRGLKRIKHNSKYILALVLAVALFVGNMAGVSAKFNAGQNSSVYTFSTFEGNVTIQADSATASGGNVGYKYKGTIYLPAYVPMRVSVKGYYYDSRGYLSTYRDSAESQSAKTLVAGNKYVSGVGVCDSSHRATSTGYVFDEKVATAQWPK